MRIALVILLLSFSSAATAHAGGHDLLKAWARHFGVHKGAGYHAPKPLPCGPGGLHEHAHWDEPLPAAPFLPMPHVAPPYHPAVEDRSLPAPQPALQLQREARRGPHYFSPNATDGSR